METNNKILIVDDNGGLRKSLNDILRLEGYESMAVYSGAKALKIIKQEKPAIALIDLKLVNMSGLEVMKGIKQDSPNTECIVLTGHATKQSAIEAVNLGAYSYVQKPYDIDQLLLTIRRAMEKHKAKVDLCIERDNLVAILNSMEDGVYITNQQHDIEYVNQAIKNEFGPPNGSKCYEYFHRRKKICPNCKNGKVLTEKNLHWEHYFTKNKKTYDIVGTHLQNHDGSISRLEILRDITMRKQAEKKLKQKHKIQSVLKEMLSISLKPYSLVKMLDCILDHISSIPWLSLPKGAILLVEDEPGTLVLKSYRKFSKKLIATCSRVNFGRCHCGRAASTQKIQFADSIDDRHDNRINDMSPHGHYCAPILSSGMVLGVLSLYLKEGHRRNMEEEIFLLSITNGLAAIIERKRTEEKLKESLKKSQRILGETVSALSSALAMRDPYTAGHQKRVAQLARAMGQEMYLAPEQIEGIRIAGTLHDIGKIYIPAEILSKPARLSQLEFNFMKTHPKIGYEILKEIEFNWPVAKAVLQHHERLNGRGYPAGLADDGIIIEAKILAVADVIEAMSSHRPYRPAQDINIALEEISQNKGILYDIAVADAALRLFMEKGFKLE